jgi:hypothetical protein
LNGIKDQLFLDNPKLGFNRAAYNSSFDDLNDHSRKIGGEYFTEKNYTNLNPNFLPYILNRTYFINTKYVLDLLVGNKTLAEEKIVNYTRSVDRAVRDLINIEISINNTDSVKTEIGAIPKTIFTKIDVLGVAINSLKGNGTELYREVFNLFFNSTTKIYSFLECSKFGDFYDKQIKQNLCTSAIASTYLATAACFAIAFLFAFLYPVLLETTKKVGHPYRERPPPPVRIPVQPVQPTVSTNASSSSNESSTTTTTTTIQYNITNYQFDQFGNPIQPGLQQPQYIPIHQPVPVQQPILIPEYQSIPEVDFNEPTRKTDGYQGPVTMAFVTQTEREVELPDVPEPEPEPIQRKTDGYQGPVTMAFVTETEVPKPPSPPKEPIGIIGGVAEIPDDEI